MDGCLGWLPTSFLPARFAPEQQCVAVLSLAQLLLVWALPIVILSRQAPWFRASVPVGCGSVLEQPMFAVMKRRAASHGRLVERCETFFYVLGVLQMFNCQCSVCPRNRACSALSAEGVDWLRAVSSV